MGNMLTTNVAVTGGTSTVQYLVTGSGSGLVLVHGTAGTPSSWQPVIDALSGRCRVVAPTLSGSGGTSDPGGDLSVDDLAAQVVAAADAAGLDTPPPRWALARHGCRHCRRRPRARAGRRPVRARRLMAADRRSAFQFDLLARLLLTDPELTWRYILLHVSTRAAQESTDFEALVHGNMPVSAVRQFDFNARVDITDRVAAVTAPTQVIAGRHDQIVPMGLQQQLAEAILHAKQTILPTAHALPFDQPDLFIKLLADFLAETAAKR